MVEISAGHELGGRGLKSRPPSPPTPEQNDRDHEQHEQDARRW